MKEKEIVTLKKQEKNETLLEESVDIIKVELCGWSPKVNYGLWFVILLSRQVI